MLIKLKIKNKMGTHYYYLDDSSQQHGPFTFEPFEQLCSKGVINSDTLVWTDGLNDWTPAEQVEELENLFLDFELEHSKKEFFYLLGNDTKGPLYIDQLKSVGLKPDTLVWTEGMSEWKPARNVKELQDVIRKMRPPAPSNYSPRKNRGTHRQISVGKISLAAGLSVLCIVLIIFINAYLRDKTTDAEELLIENEDIASSMMDAEQEQRQTDIVEPHIEDQLPQSQTVSTEPVQPASAAQSQQRVTETVQTANMRQSQQNVYVAGWIDNRAVLWVNGVAQYLPSGYQALSVFVSGNDVYVAGIYGHCVCEMYDMIPCGTVLWKNGVAQVLTNDGDVALSVFISGNDVYVAGGYRTTSLWKNGTVQVYNDGRFASSVYVVRNDVYIAGNVIGDGNSSESFRAVLWKNGVEQNLSADRGFSSARSVFVSGNDVYVAGQDLTGEIYHARLWKNGIVQELTQSANYTEASSVFVFGNDVYVAGMQYSNRGSYAVLWKNGVIRNLTDGNGRASANSVYVSGNDVYVAGTDRNRAVLWKNGVARDLGSGGANSVFVK